MSNRKFHMPGIFVMLSMALPIVLALMVFCCENSTTNDIRAISSELSGKWEVSKILINGIEHPLPYSGISSGGYLFTSNSLASYINGDISFETRGIYTENNRVYSLDGQAGYFYRISGNTLNIIIDGSSSIIAARVSGFSWE